jgi:hypothetical protein
MKIVFFAYIPDGRVSGFCPWRADGDYAANGHGLTAADRAENNPLDEDETIIDIVECKTFNDAKRHLNFLAGRDPEKGIDEWGEEELTK